jgi:hypothetical protein
MTSDSLTVGTAPYLPYLFVLYGRELQVKAVGAPPMPPMAVVALGGNNTEPLP